MWEKESQIAKGKTSKLADVASAIRVCLEKKQRGSNLVLQLPFVRVTDSGASYERGTFVDDAWQRFLEGGLTRRNNEAFHWDELERFIRLASERPERRRLLPYTSEFRFSVTPLSRPPDNVVPVVWPLGNGRFIGHLVWGGDRLEGDAEHVLDAFVDSVRDLPAWRHDVEDDAIQPAQPGHGRCAELEGRWSLTSETADAIRSDDTLCNNAVSIG